MTTPPSIPNEPASTGHHDAREIRAAWIQAIRLRTLPLAASGSFIAAGFAALHGVFRPGVFALMFVVSMLLQVIANFADDYGDLSHGLDDDTRIGPRRGMQRGIITPRQMRHALIGLSVATFVLGCGLIAVAFTGGPAMGKQALGAIATFVVLGIASIAAAVLYTVGPHPYGYLGLGDIMSALFFGVVAVVGGSFLYLHQFHALTLVAGIALGLPVAAVMNINNMRDSTADAAKGKRTIANRLYAMGMQRAGGQRGETQIATTTHMPCNVATASADHEPAGNQGAPAAHVTAADAPAASVPAGNSDTPSAHALVDGKNVLDASALAGGSLANSQGESTRNQGAPVIGTPAGDPSALAGERAMRLYHRVLIGCSLAFFTLVVVCTGKSGTLLPLRLIVLCAAFFPLLRATNGACRQLDHTKLDRFMAPTSMGTVLVAIGVTACLVIA